MTTKKKKNPATKPPAEDTAAPAGKSFEEEAAEIMSNAADMDLLGQVESICGITLRPITTATISLLKMTGNYHISGLPLDQIPNLPLDSAKFVILQDASRTVPEAAKLARDEDLLDAMAFELLDTIPASDNGALNTNVILLLKAATVTRVRVVPREGDEEGEGDGPGNG